MLGCLAVTNPTDCFAQSRRYTTRALGRAFGITSPPERPARHREARGGGDAIDASPIEGRALSLDRGAANRRFFRAPTWSCHRSFGLSQRTLGADATASPASISRYRAHRYAEQPRGASDGQAQPLPILASFGGRPKPSLGGDPGSEFCCVRSFKWVGRPIRRARREAVRT